MPQPPDEREPLSLSDALHLLLGLLPAAFYLHALTRAASLEAEIGSLVAAIIFGFLYLYLRLTE